MRDRAFHGIAVTQFLGAFNDNLYKQLMLLLALPTVVAGSMTEVPSSVTASGEPAAGRDQQAVAFIVFALPFVIASPFAGWLSDRMSKRTIIVASKYMEILVMFLGMLGFLGYRYTGYGGLLAVLFLMGLQSTFFGPGKYGILPELFRNEDIPRANGIIVMTTFLAIILGTSCAGGLDVWLRAKDLPLEQAAPRLWIGSLICVAIAIAGTYTSHWIRPGPASDPKLRLSLASLGLDRAVRQALFRDRPLVLALLATCVFWMMSGIAMQAVNSLGAVQLQVNSLWTSILVALIGLGIAIGAVVAGKISQGKADFRIARMGSWGLTLASLPLAFSRELTGHWLGYWGCAALLLVLGISAGMFAIPVQVFLQSRPSAELKGRVIALMNQANFIAILLAGAAFSVFNRWLEDQHYPRCWTFAAMAILMLPLALFYGPSRENEIHE
jgi:MFS family permease